MRQSIRKRLMSKVKITNLNDCWKWEGYKNKWGYGQLKGNGPGTETVAHRISWILFRSQIPEGLWVLHKCDNPSCVNPLHLFLGTPKDNTQDMIKKKRKNVGKILHCNDENHPASKLTNNQVKEIRSSNLSSKELSEIYLISSSAIRTVKRGDSYKDVI